MSHSIESIDALIREGTSLKNRIGMIARTLETDATEKTETFQSLPVKEAKVSEPVTDNIRLITPLAGGLEKTITDVFSMLCNFDGIDHCGIYIFNRRQRQFYLICHYNMPDEFLARVITLNRDSWLGNEVLKGVADYQAIQGIPMHLKIAYEQRGIQSMALIPLIHHGQVVGYMNLASQKEELATGFEKQFIEWLAMRISRTVALHLAMFSLSRSNERLCDLMAKMSDQFDLVIRTSGTEPINGLFAGMKDEIEGLFKATSMATEKIMQKIIDGQRRRELPFLQKKVDAMLHDIDLIMQITGRLEVFCNSQSTTLEREILQHHDASETAFLDSVSDFYHALEVLVMNDKKQTPSNMAFIEGRFIPLNRPVRLTDLKIRIDRLTPN
jgi:hypothetical protein